MNAQQQQQFVKLYKGQGELQRLLAGISERMGELANPAINLTPERWNELWNIWEEVNTKVQEAGANLEKFARSVGLQVDSK